MSVFIKISTERPLERKTEFQILRLKALFKSRISRILNPMYYNTKSYGIFQAKLLGKGSLGTHINEFKIEALTFILVLAARTLTLVQEEICINLVPLLAAQSVYCQHEIRD